MTIASCTDCETIFPYEERDLFSGEIYCPSCMSRTDDKHRTKTLAQAKKKFPGQSVYRDPRAKKGSRLS